MFPLLKENIRIAFGSIRTQILRTTLTVMIIGLGIMALVVILSAVSVLENTLASDFSSMGANTFNLQRYGLSIRVGNGPGGGGERTKINPVISYRNVKEFEENYTFPGTKTSLSFVGTQNAEVKFENSRTDPEVTVLGINENFLDNSGLELSDGRELNYFDVENSNSVCIIGSDLMKALLEDVNPIGKTLSIRGNKFKVIGVLEEKGSTFGNNQDLRMLIPLQKARTIYTNPNINYNLSVKSENVDLLQGAEDEATLLFRNIRSLSPIEENDFAITRSDDLLQRIGENFKVLYIAAWIISIITIFGSSIALMNIMLVSVSERTREIGVRKALGAKQKTIAGQFFIETIIVSQMGGIFGMTLGILIGLGLSAAFGFSYLIPWFAMFWAIGITFIVAMLSGAYPASKASRLDPIESLRYE